MLFLVRISAVVCMPLSIGRRRVFLRAHGIIFLVSIPAIVRMSLSIRRRIFLRAPRGVLFLTDGVLFFVGAILGMILRDIFGIIILPVRMFHLVRIAVDVRISPTIVGRGVSASSEILTDLSLAGVRGY